MMAFVLMAYTMTVAAKSDALKAITKSKVYAEASQLLQTNLAQLADNAEKAEAYNHLVDLAMASVQEKEKAGDMTGLCDDLCLAIENTFECDKYDRMPDAKGVVKPKFADKNAQRLWDKRKYLLNVGDDFRQKEDAKNAMKYWTPYLETFESPIFRNNEMISKVITLEQETIDQVALLACYLTYQLKEKNNVIKYAEIAKKNDKYKEDAFKLQIGAMLMDLKTKEDSLNCLNQLKQMYEADPENDVVFENLNNMYDGMKDKAAQNAFIDGHLAKYPNSYIAMAAKGFVAIGENNADEAAKWLRKATEVKADNAVIWTYLGICLNVIAANSEDVAAGQKVYDEAIAAFDKAKELDPNKTTNWGYNRYQAYYGRYGENDPKTKAAEADIR